MKLYSPVEEHLPGDEQTTEKPAPYNWLALLIIFVGYILFALIF
jgi:hypothetical protein